ncbi:hypothetical protein [Archangium violaceum]|uniref:hypothetical protein n=1 Tax=Archangium violaceum TaxID=83451 RepID=UPI001EF1012B|nr:hypothetical protein [Archangium violaceum]
MRIHGHGLVQRQQRGPPGPGQPARTQVLACRRYQCQGCGAVWTVLPASAVARKHFSAAAIALALALWGLCGLGVEQVRGLVNDWKHTGAMPGRWRSLGRWAEQVATGSLFSALEVHVEGPRAPWRPGPRRCCVAMHRPLSEGCHWPGRPSRGPAM